MGREVLLAWVRDRHDVPGYSSHGEALPGWREPTFVGEMVDRMCMVIVAGHGECVGQVVPG